MIKPSLAIITLGVLLTSCSTLEERQERAQNAFDSASLMISSGVAELKTLQAELLSSASGTVHGTQEKIDSIKETTEEIQESASALKKTLDSIQEKILSIQEILSETVLPEEE